MNYCINPSCPNRQNAENAKFCQACGTQLLVHERYRLIKPLRQLSNHYCTEIFEIADQEETATPKVLKILKKDAESLKLVKLFEQEAKVLIDLEHPGIPKTELDGYFTVLTSHHQKLRCLVMEKIEGSNLEQWIAQNGCISEKLTLNWLRQLTEILMLVHANKLFHRDIKPSNIMLRPNGQLVLIDFGVARRVTQTVIEGQNVTVVYSHGYTAVEQIEGSAVPQSDFFALGRTFIHLLTGISPNDLPKSPESGQLIWRDKAQASKPLADLIDQLMARFPKDRPQDAKAILQCLDKIEKSSLSHKWLVAGVGSGLIGNNLSNKQLVAGLMSGVGVVVSLLFVLGRPKQVPETTLSIAAQTKDDPSATITKPPCFKDYINLPKGIFNHGGSTSWAPIRQLVDPAINQSFPDFRLRYEQPIRDEGNAGSSTGIKMLLRGRLTIVQSSRPFLKEENEEARQQGFSLRQVPVALDAVAVAVHPQLDIPGLSVTQLREIYTGKIRNWQTVGGPDLEITPRVHPSIGWFAENILKEAAFSPHVSFVTNTTLGLRQVAQDPSAIYYTSAPVIIPQCSVRPLPIGLKSGKFIAPYQELSDTQNSCSRKVNQEAFKNGDYPLTRNLYVIFKDFPEEDNIEEIAGRAYANLLLTAQGQQLIEKAGYVPIRSSNQACPSP